MLFMGVEHKETYFHFALTAEQLEALKFVMDHATIDFDSAKEPDALKHDKYFREVFYPEVKKIVEGG